MNFISLGYFCSVAIELAEFGIRKESSPFDWLITDFYGVIYAINNNFKDFLEYDYLYQDKNNHSIYKNIKYGISFYHDFNQFHPVVEQLDEVQKKYERRIKRFYQTIKEPTLFIRYISDEELINGKSKELIWIENNYDQIITLIKSFNQKNDILFIANDGCKSDKIKIYNVRKDKNDTVARHPFKKNKELYDMFNGVEVPNKQYNKKKYKRKFGLTNKIFKK